MNMEPRNFNTAENNNQTFEMEFSEAKDNLINNSDEISSLVLDKQTSSSKFTAKANMLMSRVVHILPDASKLSKMDGRANPLTSEIGNSLTELFQYIQNQVTHVDSNAIQMVLGALAIQFLTLHVGAKSVEKIQKFIEGVKS